MPWLPRRPRRLMGIFRCYGWGPGCSSSHFPFRRPPSKPHVSKEPEQRPEMFEKEAEISKEPNGLENPPPEEIRVLQTTSRFHPFFALISGQLVLHLYVLHT